MAAPARGGGGDWACRSSGERDAVKVMSLFGAQGWMDEVGVGGGHIAD